MCHKAEMKPTCQPETLSVLHDDLTQEFPPLLLLQLHRSNETMATYRTDDL